MNPTAHASGGPMVLEDGRHARRERNRLAVVDAMLELYQEGNLDPSSDEIAERAGLSPRSLFRYFDDLDDLVRAAIARQHERVLPLAQLDVASDLPLAQRIDRLIEQRLRLYDAIGSAATVARLRSPFQPLIAGEIARSRSFLRRQVRSVFAPELDAKEPVVAASVHAAIDILCSFESFQLLRTDQRLTRARVATVLHESIMRLLGGI